MDLLGQGGGFVGQTISQWDFEGREAQLKHKEKEFSLPVLWLGRDVRTQDCAPEAPDGSRHN